LLASDSSPPLTPLMFFSFVDFIVCVLPFILSGVVLAPFSSLFSWAKVFGAAGGLQRSHGPDQLLHGALQL
jgi:hypothetical protein